MEKQIMTITGGVPLSGKISVQGSKNGSLPVLAASLLCNGTTELEHCPEIDDTDTALEILRVLGCDTERVGKRIVIHSETASGDTIPDDLMRRMRSSVVFLGAILARQKRAVLSQPGGCPLGPRPIDMHLAALQTLGMSLEETNGCLVCTAERLTGSRIVLPFPSVGATENVLLAACTAEGQTQLLCAACEPEIVELSRFLNACGARIRGAGSSEIVIDGVPQLHGTTYRLESDRIVAATFLAAGAITGGSVEAQDIPPEQLRSILSVMGAVGCRVTEKERSVRVDAPEKLGPLGTLQTMPYPGFPTDGQAICMAMATVAAGTSVFVENIFSDRYKHCPELVRMGARIRRIDRLAVVEGVDTLYGADILAEDLRGGAALLLAALCARGKSRLSGLSHIARGYEKIGENLRSLGARIEIQ